LCANANSDNAFGLSVGCHSLRHAAITLAADLAPSSGYGLEKIRAYSRHRSITTLMMYTDGQSRTKTQRNVSDLVAGALIGKA